MYCSQIVKARKALNQEPLNPLPEFPSPPGLPLLQECSNYYTPEMNCLASVGGKNLCGICGEKHKWKKNGGNPKTHTTKCCPYKFHSGISSKKEFVDAMAEMIKHQYNENIKIFTAMDIDMWKWKDECDEWRKNGNTISNELTEVRKDYELVKSLFSPEQIQERWDKMVYEKKLLADCQEEMDEKLVGFKEREKDVRKKELLLQIRERNHKNLKLIAEKNCENTEIIDNLELKNFQLEVKKNMYASENALMLADNTYLLSVLQNGSCKSVPEYVGETCCFCIEKINLKDKVVTTNCEHYFHTKCYSCFIVHKTKELAYGEIVCPLCRKNLHTIEYDDT